MSFSRLIPSSLKRREEAKKKREEEERVKRQQEEILKKQKKAKEELIALAEAYRRKVADLNSIDAKKLVAALRAVGVTTHACPVCNTNVGVDKFYCPTCGWSISPIDHVEGAEYLSLINTEQLEVVREIHRKLIAADDTVTLNANLQEENQTLRDKIVELSEQVERVEAQSLWNEQRLTDARRQREELEQYSLALLEKFKTLEQENANLQDKLLSLQTESQKNVHSIHSKYLPYADLSNKAVFEKALDKDVEACREMARRYYYGLNGYKKNVDSANNYLMKVGLPLYETEGDSSILPQQNNIEGHPKSLKFTYNGKDFYMILSPDKTYYVGNVKAANGDFSWLNSSWMQIGGGAALTAGAIALGVLAWPMAVALFIKALGTWTNDKERKNNIQKLCDELSKSSGYKFAKPTEKELEGVKQEEKDFCIVLRVKENPNLIPTKEKSSTAKEIKKEVEYKVKLLSVGGSRYKVVNSIMNTTCVNEAEAEYLVRKVPCELFGSFSFEEAQKIKYELEFNGAKVAIKEL